MSDYGNRRTEARKNMTRFILVHDAKRGELLGYLRDLTPNGARITGEKTQEVNRKISLSIEIPDDIRDRRAKTLNITSEVKRCVQVTENPNSYEIGFEFIALRSDQKECIDKFLARYHF